MKHRIKETRHNKIPTFFLFSSKFGFSFWAMNFKINRRFLFLAISLSSCFCWLSCFYIRYNALWASGSFWLYHLVSLINDFLPFGIKLRGLSGVVETRFCFGYFPDTQIRFYAKGDDKCQAYKLLKFYWWLNFWLKVSSHVYVSVLQHYSNICISFQFRWKHQLVSLAQIHTLLFERRNSQK